MDNNNEVYIGKLKSFLKNNMDGKSNLKAEILLKHFQGQKTKQLSNEYAYSQRTIQRYISDFQENGESSLNYKEFKKRKIVSDEIFNELTNKMQLNPLDFGLAYSVWDEYTLKALLNRDYGIDASPNTYKNTITSVKDALGSDFWDLNYQSQQQITQIINQYSNSVNTWFIYFKYLGKKKYETTLLKKVNRHFGVVFLNILNNDHFMDVIHNCPKRLNCMLILSELLQGIKEGLFSEKSIIIMEYSKQGIIAIQDLTKRSPNESLFFLLIPKCKSDNAPTPIAWVLNMYKHISYKPTKNKKLDDDIHGKICFCGLGTTRVEQYFEELLVRLRTIYN